MVDLVEITKKGFASLKGWARRYFTDDLPSTIASNAMYTALVVKGADLAANQASGTTESLIAGGIVTVGALALPLVNKYVLAPISQGVKNFIRFAGTTTRNAVFGAAVLGSVASVGYLCSVPSDFAKHFYTPQFTSNQQVNKSGYTTFTFNGDPNLTDRQVSDRFDIWDVHQGNNCEETNEYHVLRPKSGVFVLARCKDNSWFAFKRKKSLNEQYFEMYQNLTIKSKVKPHVNRVVRKILRNKDRYEHVADETGVPWFVVAAIHYRESSLNFNTYLHNGQLLGRETTIRPKRLFFEKDNWEGAAIHAMEHYFVQRHKKYGLLEAIERFNGTGYRTKKRKCGFTVTSPYLWGGSNYHTMGKYVKDGVFDCRTLDKQVGALTIIKALQDKCNLEEVEIQ